MRGSVVDSAWQKKFILFCAALFAVWMLNPPLVPDLAAQTARAEAAREGAYLWWTGWFGGITMPSYSVIAPVVMAHVGVVLSAAVAGLVACAAAPTLFADTRRPRAAAVVFSAGAFLNVATGRVTFALGFAGAVVAAVLLKRRHDAGAVVAALIACLFSPLAGLWLGLIAVTVAIVDASRRRPAMAIGTVLFLTAAVLAVTFPSGTMSFPLWHFLLGALAVVTTAAVCPVPAVRVGAAVFGVALVAFAVVPNAVGTNMMRLIWLTAGPVIIATAAPVLRRAGIAFLVAWALAWPVTDLSVQVAHAGGPQSQQEYYAPLVDALQRATTVAGRGALGQRVEIVDPVSHWSAAYVAPTVPIARGWDRQADRAANPIFYDGTLTPASYRTWLSELAVRWVAMPKRTSVDYAARTEADLIRSGLPYLQSIWQDENWELFSVADSEPLVRGASVVGLDPGAVTFAASEAGMVVLQIRYSPQLTLRGADGRAAGCVQARGAWTEARIDNPGTYTLISHLALLPNRGNTCD